MSDPVCVYVLVTTRSDFLGTFCEPSAIDVQRVEGVYRRREAAEAEGERLMKRANSWDGPTSFDVEQVELID